MTRTMREIMQRKRIATTPVLAALLALAACSSATGGAEQRVVYEPDLGVLTPQQHRYDEWLELDLELNTQELRFGETLVMDLTIRNRDPEAHWVGLPDGCHDGYSLWAAPGERVASPPRFCTMAGTRLRFEPGSTSRVHYEWTWEEESIPPGVYTLTVGLGSDGRRPAADPVAIVLR